MKNNSRSLLYICRERKEKLTMAAKVFIVMLLLLILTDDGTAFGRKRSANCRKDKEEALIADEQNSTADYYYDCDPTEFGVVQKVPYLPPHSGCDAIEIDFSSACIRCGMCLAIAEKVDLNQSFARYSLILFFIIFFQPYFPI